MAVFKSHAGMRYKISKDLFLSEYELSSPAHEAACPLINFEYHDFSSLSPPLTFLPTFCFAVRA